MERLALDEAQIASVFLREIKRSASESEEGEGVGSLRRREM